MSRQIIISKQYLNIIKRALRYYRRKLDNDISIENKLLRLEKHKNNKIMKLSHTRNVNEKQILEYVIKDFDSIRFGGSNE